MHVAHPPSCQLQVLPLASIQLANRDRPDAPPRPRPVTAGQGGSKKMGSERSMTLSINQFESAMAGSRAGFGGGGQPEEAAEMESSPDRSQPSSHAGSPAISHREIAMHRRGSTPAVGIGGGIELPPELRHAASAFAPATPLGSDAGSFRDSETDSFKVATALPALTPFKMHLKFARQVSPQPHARRATRASVPMLATGALQCARHCAFSAHWVALWMQPLPLARVCSDG